MCPHIATKSTPPPSQSGPPATILGVAWLPFGQAWLAVEDRAKGPKAVLEQAPSGSGEENPEVRGSLLRPWGVSLGCY